MFKGLALALALALTLAYSAFAKEDKRQGLEADQQISDFSLSGYAEKGKKAWEISGKTADIFEEMIRLDNIIGDLYGEEEDIRLTADKGDFNKVSGKIHLEQNVVITTSKGAQLTSDSLDWDRKAKIIDTADPVTIIRENMMTTGVGATGETALNRVTLHKDVRVDINPKKEETESQEEAGENKIIITCDGPLEVNYKDNIAIFKKNVKVDTKDNLIYSDMMDVYFLAAGKNNTKNPDQEATLMGTKIDKIVARGNVRIIRGENLSYSQEAVYTAHDKRIVLTGQPKLIIYSTEDLSASFGD